MMKKGTLETCPMCGSKLSDDFKESEMLIEMSRLKQQGVLEHTMFVAISIVKTMNDNNPAWLREILEKYGEEVKESLKSNTDELFQSLVQNDESRQKQLHQMLRYISDKLSELMGSPQTLGKIQELSIAKRLSSLKLGDDAYTTEKSNKSMEDVECVVKENGTEYGKIVIESKRTKKWNTQSLEQIKKYMEKENTKFGMLVSQVFPDDALNETEWRNGVLIVKPEHIESAYYYMRRYLILSAQLETAYQSKLQRLEVRDQVIQELRDSVSNGELDDLIEKINTVTLGMDESFSKIESYLEQRFRSLKKETGKIRGYAAQIMSDHIEKIRMHLIDEINQILNEQLKEQSISNISL